MSRQTDRLTGTELAPCLHHLVTEVSVSQKISGFLPNNVLYVNIIAVHDGYKTGNTDPDASSMYMYSFEEMDDVSAIANYLDARPGLYEAFMAKINPESFDDLCENAEYCTYTGVICV